MKRLKKMGIILMVLFSMNVAADEMIKCEAKVLTSPCGSGSIKMIINKTEKTFNLSYGDVFCWFLDIKISGEFFEAETPHGLFTASSFRLMSDKNSYIGYFHYKDNLAQLNTGTELITYSSVLKEMGGVTGKYNLTCEDIPDCTNTPPHYCGGGW